MNIQHALTHVCSTKELNAQGLSNSAISRKTNSGELTKLRRGIYCPTPTLQQLNPYERYPYSIAAVHKQHPETIFSHRAAAWVHGLSLIIPNPPVDVLVTPNSRGRPQHIIKHYTTTETIEIELHNHGIRTTTLSRTLEDCARYLPLTEAVCIINSALNQGKAESTELAQRFNHLKGKGAARARATLPYLSAHCESPGETLLLILIITAGLPRPIQQKKLVIDGQIIRPDMLFEDEKLIIEFDGRLKYTNYGPTNEVLIKESEREKRIKNQGWEVLRYTWKDVHQNPTTVAAEIQRALWNRCKRLEPR